MCTGQAVRLRHIRAGRPKPGLMRQHLTCVQTAQVVSGAQVQGATLGSATLHLVPGPVRAGEYCFSVGSAGSCTLVLQTVWPALLQATPANAGPSRLVLGAALPAGLAARELQILADGLGWPPERLHVPALPPEEGPGHAVMATLRHALVSELASGFGDRRRGAPRPRRPCCRPCASTRRTRRPWGPVW